MEPAKESGQTKERPRVVTLAPEGRRASDRLLITNVLPLLYNPTTPIMHVSNKLSNTFHLETTK